MVVYLLNHKLRLIGYKKHEAERLERFLYNMNK